MQRANTQAEKKKQSRPQVSDPQKHKNRKLNAARPHTHPLKPQWCAPASPACENLVLQAALSVCRQCQQVTANSRFTGDTRGLEVCLCSGPRGEGGPIGTGWDEQVDSQRREGDMKGAVVGGLRAALPGVLGCDYVKRRRFSIMWHQGEFSGVRK